MFDSSVSLSRIVQVVSFSAASNNVQIQLPTNGRPWWYSCCQDSSASFLGSAYVPNISASSGNLVTISKNELSGLGAVDCVVVLGVY